LSDFGLTPQGFNRKKYEDILLTMETQARALFGENVNLSVRSPLGLFIKVVAWTVSIIWQLAEKVYYSAYVDDAEGIQLDKTAKNIGIVRRGPEKATGIITVSGTEGTEITPYNLTVGTLDNITYVPAETKTIDATGQVDVSIVAVAYGTIGNVPGGTITQIITPIAGVDSVTNAAATSGGRNAETDEEFRDRYYNSTSKAGASTIDSITASLLNAQDVRTALVKENTTMAVDSDGRPPKSIQCYVLGGVKASVAQAIFDTKPAGIETYGTESEFVTDISGRQHTVKFSYATVKNIYLNINLVRNSQYTSDGDKLIKTEIVKYIGGTDADGQLYNGTNIGDDVIFTKLVSVISKVAGVEDFELTIGLAPESLSSANIVIADIEVAETAPDKVVISYV
jgi:uncharacterized phage protein gp47/JayE